MRAAIIWAKEHWQIVNWQGKGGVRVGKWGLCAAGGKFLRLC